MGRIPIRRSSNGELPYDGSTADGDWVGYVPFDELPNLYNPKAGFIVTANQRTVGTSYKYPAFTRDAAMPWRARRIFDLLSANEKVTMDNTRDIQYDVVNLPLKMLAADIVKLGAASDETLDVLKDWDGRMTADSKAALITNEIRGCLANAMAAENKPAPANLIRERVLYKAVSGQSKEWLPRPFSSYRDFIRACDGTARAALADPKRFGMDKSKWVWGNANVSRFPHPLSSAPLIGLQFSTPAVPINGSGQTPNVGSYASMRHIASPGNWDITRLVIPLGESGDPSSAYYKDQFEAWRSGTPQTVPFSARAVLEKTSNELRLVP
jgi:penicillin amidase